MATKTNAIKPGEYIVITTTHRGVFGGKFVARDLKGSRVSPAAPEMIVP